MPMALTRGRRVPDSFVGSVELATSSALVLRGRASDGPCFVTVDGLSGAVPSPWGVTVAPFSTAGVLFGERVLLDAPRLSVGSRHWRLPAACAGTRRRQRGIAAAVRWLRACDRPEIETAYGRVGCELAQVIAALEHRDDRHLTGAVQRLIGLGPGLTPSGDDCLAGLFAVLTGIESGDVRHRSLQRRLSRAVASLLNTTTDFSAFVLRCAMEGDVHDAIDDVVRSGSPDECARRVERLAHVGASSGADALLGVVTGARLVSAKALA